MEKLDLSQGEEDALDRMSCSLVAKLFLGPIPEALAEVRASNRDPDAEGTGPTSEQFPEGKHLSRSF